MKESVHCDRLTFCWHSAAPRLFTSSYILAVSEFDFTDIESVSGLNAASINNPNTEIRLTNSSRNGLANFSGQIPEPATLGLLGLGLAGGLLSPPQVLIDFLAVQKMATSVAVFVAQHSSVTPIRVDIFVRPEVIPLASR